MGKHAAVARGGKRKRDSNLWLWVLAITGLVIIVAGVVIYAVGSQGPAEPQGVLKAERIKQDIGNVPYGGGLAKATFNLTAQGGPVTVKSITTT